MSVKLLKNYIGGAWVEAESSGSLEVENPSTGEVLAMVPLSTEAECLRAIAAAKAAFGAWSATPVARRTKSLHALLALLEANEGLICRTLSAEMGKSLPDAAAEVKRVVENLEVACAMPVLQQGKKLIGASFDIDGEILRLPMGVFGMIPPFNFPAMVPFWFLPYALATGNTYVCKTSKQVPMTMALITEYIDEVGLPPGVFNLVHGDKAVAETIMSSPDVKGVSFVGSTKVAGLVAEKCAATRKRFQAMGSAKNHLVIMPDARIDEVIRNMISSCYGCAGQRCMAASVIVCVGEDTYRMVVDRFVAASRKVIVADPLDPAVAKEPMVMGPVISAAAKARIVELIGEGEREGAKLALDGRGCVVKGREKGHFVGPTVLVDVAPGMAVHATEIFGPVVCMMKAKDLDEAIGIINDGEYGNGASIYTQNGYYARKFKLETNCGMIGVNVGIPAPVAYLPFGGMKASQFADIKAQGEAVIAFFTEERIVTERYWAER